MHGMYMPWGRFVTILQFDYAKAPLLPPRLETVLDVHLRLYWGGSVSARSHTLHCYSLDNVAKTQNLRAVLHVNH